ncbi:prenyltransferase/squalene oxidase repeat-containing protein [Kitasatospora mediocidica]|uniref:prenyltransferase/squalene oxidase repeat-containing protein n=1 Tax=Kitasatospora mediocidica TaxID=58352 RepID=UPI00068F895B|nr:prenyltransferase/squalene oxidase repeat-containing protein [Kitasatospora mediocidica]
MSGSALLPVPGARRGRPADPGVLRSRDLLAQRLAARMGTDGLLAAPGESRLLESALALHLLTVEQAEPSAAERLRHYLRGALDGQPTDPVQRAIARAALGEHVPGGSLTGGSLTGGSLTGGSLTGGSLTGLRHGGPVGAGAATAAKAALGGGPDSLMFRAVLAELGVADLPRLVPGEFGGPDQPGAHQLELAAVRVLAAHGAGTPRAVTGQDWAALAPACRPGPAAEGNQLARLLGLLALRRNPAYRPAVRRALPDLADAQRPDGGLPFITGMDVLGTAAAGLALLDARWSGPQPGVMADALAARQNPDGGFGCHPGVSQSDVETTSRCVELLRSVAPGRHHGTITAAEEHLIAQRNPNGGFPAATRGAPSELVTTAAVVAALAANPAHHRTVAEARRFVAVLQQADGSFGQSRNGSATDAVVRAVLALTPAPDPVPTSSLAGARPADADRPGGGNRPVGERQVGARGQESAADRLRAVGWLAATQHEDGGWGRQPEEPSDPVSTAGAAVALSLSPTTHAGRGTRPALLRALEHLVATRAPDGGYRGRPEQVGPWHLPYDVPVLTEIAVLLGLARATAAGPVGEPTVLAALEPTPRPTPCPAPGQAPGSGPGSTLMPLVDLTRRR